MNQKQEIIINGLEAISSVMPMLKVSEKTIQVWVAVLSDIETSTLKKSFEDILKEWDKTRPPMPSDVRKNCLGNSESSSKIMATNAWSYVEKALKESSCFEFFVFEDLYTDYILKKIGGWDYLRSTNIDNLKWLKKDFIEFYIELKKQNKKIEIQNSPLKKKLRIGYFGEYKEKKACEKKISIET